MNTKVTRPSHMHQWHHGCQIPGHEGLGGGGGGGVLNCHREKGYEGVVFIIII